MCEPVIILGGSFNPPTIAHHQLMSAAIAAVGASKGVFVPVSQGYLKRKMCQAEAPVCLSEAQRVEMLRAMCAEEPMLDISACELQHPLWTTSETMAALQQQYPQAKLFLLAGADKLHVIEAMVRNHDFLSHYGLILVRRDGLDPMERIRQNESLSQFQDSIVTIPQPPGMEKVSSTLIRRHFLAGNASLVQDCLHEQVWALFSQLKPEDYPPEIVRFRDTYAFLSNGYPAPMVCHGLTFPNAEAAFQAARCKAAKDRLRFLHCDSGRAKAIAASVQPRDDWEDVKVQVMEDILLEKFRQHPLLAKQLLETGSAFLVNGHTGKDLFWGVELYRFRGENWLGKLLMKIRQMLYQKENVQ